jgi:hypothetical protein
MNMSKSKAIAILEEELNGHGNLEMAVFAAKDHLFIPEGECFDVLNGSNDEWLEAIGSKYTAQGENKETAFHGLIVGFLPWTHDRH